MSQITYANKQAIIENADIPVTGKVTDDDMNEIKQVVNENETKILLAVDSVAPEECSTGDMYYNTTDNLIYIATATNTWSSTGTTPTLNTIYVDFSTQSTYVYNGETLISIGGGAGGGDSTPIGTIQEYAGSTAPDGYLMCDGSAVSRTTYKDLFRVIGTTYGSGDGSTTFNLPNIKSRVVVMLDSNDTDFDTLGKTGGSKFLQEHTHTTKANVLGGFTPGTGANLRTDGGSWSYSSDVLNNAGTGNSGNLQPYIVLNKIIKVQKTAGEVLSEQLPVGTEVDFDGSASDIPIGWEQVNNNNVLYEALPIGANIDNIITFGFYGILNATGTLPSGYTSDNNIFIQNMLWVDVNWGRQILYDIRSNNTYTRQKLNGTWQSWVSLL